MASYELVDNSSMHGMIVVGPGGLDETFDISYGTTDKHLVSVRDPLSLVDSTPFEVAASPLGQVHETPPHVRFGGGIAVTEYIRNQS